jgi:hypothetical protein
LHFSLFKFEQLVEGVGSMWLWACVRHNLSLFGTRELALSPGCPKIHPRPHIMILERIESSLNLQLFTCVIVPISILQMYGGWVSNEDQARFRAQRRLSTAPPSAKKSTEDDGPTGIGPYDLFNTEAAAGGGSVPHYGGSHQDKDTEVRAQ